MMKLNVYMLLLALITWSLQSCDNNDDESISVSKELQTAFSAKYPGIKDVRWEVKSGYYVADFYDKFDASAWFTKDGIWRMTETDISYTALPSAVKATFETSEYSQAPWRREDVDKLERQDMETVFVIEVENNTQELDLYYSEEGILIKTEVDVDADDENYLPSIQLPAAMKAFVASKYIGARIIEFDIENDKNDPEFGLTEIDIFHDGISKEILFDKSGNWFSTSWDVTNLPDAVKNTINTQYPNYHVDDAEVYEMATGITYYLLELESEHLPDKLIKILVDGSIV